MLMDILYLGVILMFYALCYGLIVTFLRLVEDK